MMNGCLERFHATSMLMVCLLVANGGITARAQECLDYSAQAVRLGALPETLPEFDQIAVTESGLLVGSSPDSTLIVYSLDDPMSPIILGELDLGGRYRKMVCAGERVYLGDENEDGIRIVRIASDGAVSDYGSFNEQHQAVRFDADGTLLGLSLGEAWQLWDCADPSMPILISHIDDPDSWGPISIEGDRAILVNSGDVLHIYDLSDPHHPVVLGGGIIEIDKDYEFITEVQLAGNAACFIMKACEGSGIFVTCWHWVTVIDVSDPANMSFIGSAEFGQWGQLRRSGGRIYASSYLPDKSMVLDTDDPEGPSPKFIPAGGDATAGFGEYLLLKNHGPGISVWRVPPGMLAWPCPSPETGDVFSDSGYLVEYEMRCTASNSDFVASSIVDYRRGPHGEYICIPGSTYMIH